MNYEFYLDKFNIAAKQIDKKGLEVSVGIVLDSVFLKLYKKEWTSNPDEPMNAEARIFFSVWINDKTIREDKVFYNIHAFKLRKLKGYSITSRAFADDFRKRFKAFEHNWENVNVNFGPLTLMEGWKVLDIDNIENVVTGLANNFLEIEHLIDDMLISLKK